MGQLLAAYLNANHLHVALKNDWTWFSIRMLLFCGSDVNKRDHYGRTPLHTAIMHNNSDDIIRLLAKTGTDIDATDNEGLTPLHMAIQQNSPTQIIQYFLECGADVNLMDSEGNTALHFAAIYKHTNSLEIVDSIVVECNDINTQNEYGETAFHLGLKHDMNFVILQLLLVKRLNPLIQNHWGGNCLHYCMLYRKDYPQVVDITNLLLSHCPGGVNIQDQSGETPLHIAVKNNMAASVIQTLCQYEADSAIQNNLGCTPLHYAQSVTVTDLLFQRRGLVNVQDNRSATVLHHMLKYKEINPDLLKKALNYGCDPNIYDNQGRTALHILLQGAKHADCNLPVLVKYLLKFVIDINSRDFNGDTVLHLAVRENLPLEILHLLVGAGASPDFTNKHKVTALGEFHYVQNINYTKLLFMIMRSKNIEVRDNHSGYTFLHRILHDFGKCRCDDAMEMLSCFEELLKLGLDPNVTTMSADNTNETPLLKAFSRIFKTPRDIILPAIQMLFEFGAQPNMRINKEQTALQVLVKSFQKKRTERDRNDYSVVCDCIFLCLRAGLDLHEIGPGFIQSVMKHFILCEDWEALRHLFKYGVTVNHLEVNDSDKKLLLQMVVSHNSIGDVYPLSLFELAANELRIKLVPNCYRGLDNLTFFTSAGTLCKLSEKLKGKILSMADYKPK